MQVSNFCGKCFRCLPILEPSWVHILFLPGAGRGIGIAAKARRAGATKHQIPRGTRSGTQYLIGLRYLCCLLFKFSSVPSLENASTTRKLNRRQRRLFGQKKRKKTLNRR